VRAAAREAIAVVAALATYRFGILPQVRRELATWQSTATAIADPGLRGEALSAIDEKGLNVEATAVFAILAPRSTRSRAIRAMVALQVAIDYLDSYRNSAQALPSHAAVATALQRAVSRCGEGQASTHAAEHGDRSALQAWALTQDAPPAYRWWEVAAGGSSSVAAHALIAAAADPQTTAAEAELIDAAYFPSIGALTVLLDDLIDRDADASVGAHNYMGYYADSAEAADRLDLIAKLGRAGIAGLRHPQRHAAILAGVAGFYLSAAEAETPYAAPIRDRLLRSTGPAVRPIVAFMRRRRADGPEAEAPGP
jgi:tetraprenyl-beta-curcumene synthase